MRRLLVLAPVLFFFNAFSQTYPSRNISLIGLLAPNTSTDNVNKYAGCWGWYQASKNKEYAISAGSNGTYFVDITNPSTPTLSAFVPGSQNCTWRELKTYQNYCYVVSDVCMPNKFQIIDMQYLPDSVHVVHNSTNLFQLGHTIWIDKDKMFVASTRYTVGGSPLTIWSLATPTAPVLLRRVEQDISPAVIAEVHDMYARNDTIYVSAAYQGIIVLKYNSITNNFSQIGSYSDYPTHGYNHSSCLTQNGKYLLFCDEVPASQPIHLVNVQNLGNIQPVKDFRPGPETTPHNPFIIGNKNAIVSCYKDGVYVYDISKPDSISESGFFDTYPQGGMNTANYGGAYGGNWGAYPYLPSGVLIANDMENGVFLLNASAAYTTTVKNLVGVSESRTGAQKNLLFYPNPANQQIAINYAATSPCAVQLRSVHGQLVFEKDFSGAVNEYLNTSTFASGTYILSLTEGETTIHKKLIITH